MATLILLSYAKLLSTTIVVLSFAILDYPEGSHIVWLLDGNIKYLQGRHIGLFTAAIVIASPTRSSLNFSPSSLAVVYSNSKVESFWLDQKHQTQCFRHHLPCPIQCQASLLDWSTTACEGCVVHHCSSDCV